MSPTMPTPWESGRVHALIYAWFSTQGITVLRVLSDNGACYRSHAWRDALTTTGTTA
jgi:hypothetical protein